MITDRFNRGAIFKQAPEKITGPESPVYTGKINIDGREYLLSGWIEESAGHNGKAKVKYISIKVRPAEEPTRKQRESQY